MSRKKTAVTSKLKKKENEIFVIGWHEQFCKFVLYDDSTE